MAPVAAVLPSFAFSMLSLLKIKLFLHVVSHLKKRDVHLLGGAFLLGTIW